MALMFGTTFLLRVYFKKLSYLQKIETYYYLRRCRRKWI
jgi:hypothetical protein